MSFLLTRRTALTGGLSSLLIPAAGFSLAKAVEIGDPWDDVAHHAFALQDALRALPEQWWYTHKIGHGPDDAIAVYNPMPGSGGYRLLRRPEGTSP